MQTTSEIPLLAERIPLLTTEISFVYQLVSSVFLLQQSVITIRAIDLLAQAALMRQQRLPTNWVAGAASHSSDSSNYEDEEPALRSKKVQYWTRVKSLEQMKSQRLMVYDATNDMQFDRSLQIIRKEMAV